MKGYLGLWLVFVAALALAATGCSGASSGLDRSQSYEGTALDGAASDFRLVDQNGVPVALSDLRGKVVALAFLDPECTDACPLTAAAFRSTSEALGGDAARVGFLAVNVNPGHGSVADMAGATDKWGVRGLPTWHFLTGVRDQLDPVWKAYSIEAEGPSKPERPDERAHTLGVYLIDQAGEKRWYISTAFDPDVSLRDLLLKRIRALLR